MSTENTKTFTRLFRLIKSEKEDFKGVFFFALFVGLINLSLPLGIQAVINFLNAGQLSTSWGVLVVFVIIGVAITGLLQVKQLAITESIEQRVFTKAAFDFAYRLPRIKQSAVQNKYLPELVNRFFEIITVQKGVSKLLIDFSSAAIQILFGLLLLSLYHPLFIVFGGAMILLLWFIFKLTGPQGLKTSLEESKYKFEVAHWLEEVGRTMHTFKRIGSSTLPITKTDDFVAGYIKARKKHFKILIWQFSSLIVFKVLVAAALIILGSILVIDRQINIGQFVASEIIIVLVLNAVEKLILNMDVFYDLLTALEKIGTVTDLPLESEEGSDLREAPCKDGLNIKINNLGFVYPDGTTPILKGFNLNIEEGHFIGIAGTDGSGKTTLFKLLTGLYDNYEGTITINGLPMRSLRIDALRCMIGDNFNENDVFKGSLYENIQAGVESVTRNDVMWAAQMVGLDDFIALNATGLETKIDPEGQRLSSSLVKKIVLARAIAERPKLLLFEDSLIHLPAEERLMIYRRIMDKKFGWTIILTTNDPLVLNMCDDRYEIINGQLNTL